MKWRHTQPPPTHQHRVYKYIFCYEKDVFLPGERFAYCRVCATNMLATGNIVGMCRFHLPLPDHRFADNRPAISFSSAHSTCGFLKHVQLHHNKDHLLWAFNILKMEKSNQVAVEKPEREAPWTITKIEYMMTLAVS